jgi:methyl-accepting chemotaxis protein
VSLIASRSNEFTGELMPKQKRLAQMANEMNLIARAMRNMMILESAQALQAQRAEIDNSKRLIQAEFTALDKVLLHPEMRQSFQRLLEARTDFLASQEKFFTTRQSGSREEARRVLLDESRELQRRYMDALAALQDQRTAVGVAEIATAVTLVQRIALGMMAASALLALLLAVAIIRRVTQPLRHAVDVAHAGAEGNLAVGIRVSGRSKTTELLQALADMRHRLA